MGTCEIRTSMVSTRARTESTAFDTTGWLRSEEISLHRSVIAEVMSSETEEEHSTSTICLEWMLVDMIQAD